MNPQTIQLIFALLPLAEKLVFQIGGKLIELNTADIKSSEELVQMLQESKSHSWPKLKFVSTKPVEGE
ncbi:MAG TPA: hypothetical protein ENH31_00390 [Nitrospirae bacterium]|nr:hypothetical protein [Nitrospirota bacterium]HDK81010.1 hypothetical protein [Nitrospirota bacterium]